MLRKMTHPAPIVKNTFKEESPTGATGVTHSISDSELFLVATPIQLKRPVGPFLACERHQSFKAIRRPPKIAFNKRDVSMESVLGARPLDSSGGILGSDLPALQGCQTCRFAGRNYAAL